MQNRVIYVVWFDFKIINWACAVNFEKTIHFPNKWTHIIFFKITYSLFSIVLYIHVTLYQNFLTNLTFSTHCCTDFNFFGFSKVGDVKQTVSLNIRKWVQCPLAEKTTNIHLVWLSKGTQCRRKLLCNSYRCNNDEINTLQKRVWKGI